MNNRSYKIEYFGAMGVLITIALGVIIAPASLRGSKHSQTLANLQAAYDGESNAHARYLAFAEKADAEGYRQVAALFRAAARAEQIHLNNHAEAIQKLGAEPHAILEFPVVKSTRENLETAANKGEAYERDTTYPEFIKQARAESNDDAVRTFEYARKAEAQHFLLFTQGLQDLEGMKAAGQTYRVCKECGYTTRGLEDQDCVSCHSSNERYEVIG